MHHSSQAGQLMFDVATVKWLALMCGSTVQFNAIAQLPYDLKPTPGMTITTAIAEPVGDYESRKIYQRREGTAWLIAYVASAPSADGNPQAVNTTRVVHDKDLASAREYRSYFEDNADEDYPGTTAVSTSLTVLNALKTTGRAEFAMVGERHAANQLTQSLGLPSLMGNAQARYVGELKAAGVRQFSVALNGVATPLNAIEARGQLKYKQSAMDVVFVFLDHPTHPITLEWRAAKTTLRVVRIDLPQPDKAPEQTIVKTLVAKKRVTLPGVYFDFASAKLRAESSRALNEAAGAVRLLPASAKLRLEGHTDSIGDAASNKQLSSARAGAVREALMQLVPQIATRLKSEGYGATKPIADNATLEGRALNRRVELVLE
jgi:outer membrane protein OmpA-like peptidoglycan-associated protein